MIFWFGVCLLSPCYSQDATGGPDTKQRGFEVSFAPGARDAAGHLLGGTEVRSLVAHAGKLFAGNGYWEDEIRRLPGRRDCSYWTDPAADGAWTTYLTS